MVYLPDVDCFIGIVKSINDLIVRDVGESAYTEQEVDLAKVVAGLAYKPWDKLDGDDILQVQIAAWKGRRHHGL